MRLSLLISASTLFITLSGCATLDLARPAADIVTAQDADIPASPEAQWTELNNSEATSTLPTNDWVETFADPTLSALVDEALNANTSIRSAEAQYRAALARLQISKADGLPALSGSAQVSRNENANELIPDSTGFTGGVNASWEVDLWGRIRDQIDASEFAAAANQADYAGARLSIAGQVAQTWFDVIEARLLTDLSERDVATQERALRLTTRRFEGGITGSSDVRLARSQVANARALQASRKQVYAATRRALETLLRRYPENALQSSPDLPPLPRLGGVGVPADVIRHRPDLIAAEYRLSSAGLNVDIARKSLLPSFTLTGGLNGSAGSVSDFFDIDSWVANIAGGLTQPLFQGGRLKANVEQQEALLRAQLEQYAGLALNAYLEVENALYAEDRLAEQEAALEISLEEALKAEERLELRYSEGLATILQLLDAQSRRISAESQLINARAERFANRIRLHLALGGGAIGDPDNAILTDAALITVDQVAEVR